MNVKTSETPLLVAYLVIDGTLPRKRKSLITEIRVGDQLGARGPLREGCTTRKRLVDLALATLTVEAQKYRDITRAHVELRQKMLVIYDDGVKMELSGGQIQNVGLMP